MNLYRMEFLARPMQAQTKDALLSIAVMAVDNRSIIEKASAKEMPGGSVSILIDFLGLNENEANRTAKDAFDSTFHVGMGADSLSVKLRKVDA